MNLLTIKEYAELNGISTQAVYKKIKANKIKTTIQGGKTFIKCKDQPHKQEQAKQGNIDNDSLNKLIEMLQSQLVMKDEQIKNLMLLNGNLQGLINEKDTKLLEYTNRTFTQKIKDLFKGTKQ